MDSWYGENLFRGTKNGIRTNEKFEFVFDTLSELGLPAVVKMWLSFEGLCNLLTFHFFFFFFGNCFWLNQSAKSAMRRKKSLLCITSLTAWSQWGC